MMSCGLPLAALLAVASAASATVAADVVGTSLFQGVGDYNNLPISLAAAKAAGWKAASSACVPNRGVLHYKTDDGFPSVEQPLGIGYTPGGQIASIVVSVDGDVPKNLIDKGWWVKTNSSASYSDDGTAMPFVLVSLRSAEASCSSSVLPETMGDRVVVNADTVGVSSSGSGSVRGVNWSMPLVRSDALVDKFHVAGACVKKMGRHFPIDVSSVEQIRAGKRSKPAMSWEFSNLAPVVPMYDDFSGKINAIFVTSPDVQQSLFSTHGWDKVPLVTFLMCKNWCDDACTFDETFLSTMHLFFRNYTTYDCKGPCGAVNCCPANEALRPDSDGFTAANPASVSPAISSAVATVGGSPSASATIVAMSAAAATLMVPAFALASTSQLL